MLDLVFLTDGVWFTRVEHIGLSVPPPHTCTSPLMHINSKFCHLHQFPKWRSKHMADRAGTKGSRAYYHIKLAQSSLQGVNPVTYGFINGLHYHDQTLLQHLALTPSNSPRMEGFMKNWQRAISEFFILSHFLASWAWNSISSLLVTSTVMHAYQPWISFAYMSLLKK